MVTKIEASLVPFTLKKDQRGRIQKIAATGHRGGEILGSIQKTNDNLDYMLAGVGVQIISQSNGQLLINFAPDLAPAPADATYVVLSTTASLSDERALTAGSGIAILDNGPGSTVVISTTGAPPTGPAGGDCAGAYPNPTVVDLTITSEQQGSVLYFNGSNWVQLAPSTSGFFLKTNGIGANPVWANVISKPFDNEASYIVLSTTSSLDNERVLTPSFGINLTDGGPGGNATLGIDITHVALVSGTHFLGSITTTGTGSFEQGISGSLTRLVDNRSYLAAGANVTIISESNGQVTISAIETPPDFDWVDAGNAIYTTASVAIGIASIASTKGADVVFFVSGAISGSGFSGTSVFGGDVRISGTLIVGQGSSEVTNNSVSAHQLTGSLTQLRTGLSYLVAGANVTITSGVNGQVTITSAIKDNDTAPASASYLVLANDAVLTAERALVISTGLQSIDGGANGAFTIGVDGTVLRASGSHIIGNLSVAGTGSFNSGISGSLTQLTTGLSYLAAGDNIIITSQSNGQVSIASAGSGDNGAAYVVLNTTASLANERVLTGANGIIITDGGPGNAVTLQVNGTVARVSGTHFQDISTSGTGSFALGISGSLTNLITGQSYLAAGSNITITSQSNGQVVIASTATGGGNSVVIGSETIEVIPTPNEISGTTETLVGSVLLPSITFAVVSAMLGCSNFGDTATLKVRRFGTAVDVLTLTGSGFLSSVPSTGSVPILVAGWHDILVSNSSVSGSALVGGIEFRATGSVDDDDWIQGNSRLYTTSSVAIGTASFVQSFASDLAFYVSGSRFPTDHPYYTAFGGDVIVSGGLRGTIDLDLVGAVVEASGTIETLVESFFIRSIHTFRSGVAMLGAQSVSDTATLHVRNHLTTAEILTLGFTSGTLRPQESTGSVIFPASGWYDIYLVNSSISGSALCAGLKLLV